jgi:hypothetical protein
MRPNQLSVVILAGDRKSFKKVPDKWDTYFDLAVEAAECLRPKEILIVSSHAPALHRYRRIESGATASQSLIAGLEAANGSHVLVISADLPHISRQALAWFCAQTDESADVFFSYSPLSDCVRFGHTSKHALPLQGELVKLGSVTLLRKETVMKATPLIQCVLRNRKNVPLILYHMIGFWGLLRLALTIKVKPLKRFQPDLLWAAQKIKRRTGLRCLGVRSKAELAVDHDNPTDSR